MNVAFNGWEEKDVDIRHEIYPGTGWRRESDFDYASFTDSERRSWFRAWIYGDMARDDQEARSSREAAWGLFVKSSVPLYQT
jgi:hypothetical protein